jgi:TPR repeat protein
MSLFNKVIIAAALAAPLVAGMAVKPAVADSAVLQRTAKVEASNVPFWQTRTLADQGDAVAQYELGRRLESGDGVPRNLESARRWYMRSALQGNSWAQNNLGRMYGDGEGVTRNYVTAHMWFSIASADDNRMAQSNREFTGNRMTTMEIRKARDLAEAWLQEHPRARRGLLQRRGYGG